MIPAAINLTLFEIIILQIGAIILGITIYFFMASRRSLRQYIPEKKKRAEPVPTEPVVPAAPPAPSLEAPARQLEVIEERLQHYKQKGWTTYGDRTEPAATTTPEPPREDLVQTLRQTIHQQQQSLNGFLEQIEAMQVEGRETLEAENEELQLTIQKLEAALARKESEAEGLRQQAGMVRQMTSRIEEVYQEFDALQRKMGQLEQQAAEANNLAMDLEDVKQAYEGVRMEVVRKQEKLEEAINDSQRIRRQLNETEDKLAEANLQRQQLQKKVQFLQDLNNDLNQMSETNKKLQSELRRIGELESMLHMIAEERDQLLKRKA